MQSLAVLFKSVLYTRLQKLLDDFYYKIHDFYYKSISSIIKSNQIEFQPKARTDHMTVLRTLIENDNSKLFVCFADFAKAFDTVD